MTLFCQNHRNYWVGMIHLAVFIRAALLVLKQLHGYPSGGKGTPQDVSKIVQCIPKQEWFVYFLECRFHLPDLQTQFRIYNVKLFPIPKPPAVPVKSYLSPAGISNIYKYHWKIVQKLIHIHCQCILSFDPTTELWWYIHNSINCKSVLLFIGQ